MPTSVLLRQPLLSWCVVRFVAWSCPASCCSRTNDLEGFTSIDVCGQSISWPRAELLPREAALPVLMSVPDIDAIRRNFRWLSQWRDLEPEPAPDTTQG